MSDKIEEMLEEEIQTKISNLKNLTPGSKELSSEINDLQVLCKMSAERTKVKFDKTQVIHQIIGYALKILEIAGPIVAYIWLFGLGLKFEETGTFTATTFKNLFSRIKLTK